MELQPPLHSCGEHLAFWMGRATRYNPPSPHINAHLQVTPFPPPSVCRFPGDSRPACLSKVPLLHHPGKAFVKGAQSDAAAPAVRREGVLQDVVEATSCQAACLRRDKRFPYSSLRHLLEDAATCLPSRRPQMESFPPRAYNCQRMTKFRGWQPGGIADKEEEEAAWVLLHGLRSARRQQVPRIKTGPSTEMSPVAIQTPPGRLLRAELSNQPIQPFPHHSPTKTSDTFASLRKGSHRCKWADLGGGGSAQPVCFVSGRCTGKTSFQLSGA